MFCPDCKAEYLPGISECADCHIPLVPELQEPDHASAEGFVEVARTFNQADIALIKSVLDDNGVDYAFFDEYFTLVDPLIQPARLFVRESHSTRTRELLAGMNVRFLGVSR
jgi:hypothetical protein